MRFEIRRRGVEVLEELRSYLKDRLGLALKRFARHVDLVRVYLWDVDGPRGGVSQTCRIVVEVPPRGRVIVTETDTEIRAAIAGATNRVASSLKRHVQRRWTRRRPTLRKARRMALEAT